MEVEAAIEAIGGSARRRAGLAFDTGSIDLKGYV